ncbi:hypothetical protein JCM3775_006730 [Rhodotorula graminis]|uniref:AMP-dependent synthetase/ligase domain-containing protein n=1 Tax=Rhodotorula graminis (strain WP1) TaxID=578459 RepID=A0A194S8P5_RHOGW|nr:uncharacterized protein RHOBADRAFT_52053 [Rhodotorula graminis WP1]KPV77098.1 hypothetical protein RHOBADRAFT_52053 [Rhodotorula graminis WP1]
MAYVPPEPMRSVQQCNDLMQQPGSPFITDTLTIGKRRVRAYRNLPASVRDLWLASAETFAKREYLVYENERLTYADAHERVLRLASLLHARGVKKGDRVAIAMRNVPEWAVSWWACHLLGGIGVAVNAWLTPEAFYHCVSVTTPVALIVDAERAGILCPKVSDLRSLGCNTFLVARSAAPPSGFEPFVDALARHEPREFPRPDLSPDDDAVIFFTSGTTSLPKGVLSTQRQYLSNRWNTASGKVRAVLRKGGDIPVPDPKAPPPSVLLTVPLFHVMGNHSFLVSLTVGGGKIVLMHKFSPSLGAQLVVKEGITNASGVPNQVSALLEELPPNAEGVKLETLSYGGGAPSSRLPEEVRRRLPNALTSQGYGLTEVNSVATAFAGDDYLARPTSCGLAPPAVDLKIIPPSAPMPVSAAPALKPREVGEICIHGPNVAKGYWRDEEATRKAFDDEGWFRSGDLGYVDEEGFLFIADRAKDIIIRSGENISSVQVENALFAHDAVREVAVVPVPCEVHGEQVAAVVVLHPSTHPSRSSSARQPPPTEAALRSIAASSLPRHAVPALVILVEVGAEEEGLPKNGTGKVVKGEVKQVAAAEWEKRGLGKKPARKEEQARAKL